MRKLSIWLPLLLILLSIAFLIDNNQVVGQTTGSLVACKDIAYSTEEDFLTQGPVPVDGNPIISDGDLLSGSGGVCMRNRELLRVWDLQVDLGLDAVDVLDVERVLVAFSTELNDPSKRFSAGDLLTTWGAVIPNQVLLTLFQVQGDRGLDAVHFVGTRDGILAFNQTATAISRDEWLRDPGKLSGELRRNGIDIWFSIEGTVLRAATVSIYDGDLLSAAHGSIVLSNAALLPNAVPAGLPNRGVDFGLDGFTASRSTELRDGRFSTEILYRGELAFTDGDVLKVGDGIAIHDEDLYKPFEPKADFLGTDALYIRLDAQPQRDKFLPMILKRFLGVTP
ncbi:MAG: hypothetical protein AUK03_01940 [Anaerolineae bacterium CG2_30_64_16]|nr:MAG: hypothetical protein AUK03_01940 [Anaerolineae bacterium CG2_30_64_16]